jgi:RNA 3'-terminal phosphate cyclase
VRTERGDLRRIRVYSVAAKSLAERGVAERQAEAAEKRLRRHDVPIEVETCYADSASPGSTITCVAEFEKARLGGDALGAREKRAEDVGREAADMLAAEIRADAPVDEWAADQLVVWLALGGGEIRTSRITEHARTNVWVVERFLGDRVRIEGTAIRAGSP